MQLIIFNICNWFIFNSGCVYSNELGRMKLLYYYVVASNMTNHLIHENLVFEYASIYPNSVKKQLSKSLFFMPSIDRMLVCVGVVYVCMCTSHFN